MASPSSPMLQLTPSPLDIGLLLQCRPKDLTLFPKGQQMFPWSFRALVQLFVPIEQPCLLMFAFYLYPLKESQVLSTSQALERPSFVKTSTTNATPEGVQCVAKHALAKL